jgi:NADH-ubiquinone oxidoreductase chain 1
LRSTAQLISYELILSSAILIVILLTGNLNLTINIEAQKVVFFIIPLLPIFIIFFIGCIAETNRAPFDLAEAESELVSGFMTEHSAVIFVFFFLAEYASIVLICIFTSILFLGGYLKFFSLDFLLNVFFFFNFINIDLFNSYYTETDVNFFNAFLEGLVYSLMLGFKSCVMIFVFI